MGPAGASEAETVYSLTLINDTENPFASMVAEKAMKKRWREQSGAIGRSAQWALKEGRNGIEARRRRIRRR